MKKHIVMTIHDAVWVEDPVKEAEGAIFVLGLCRNDAV